MKSQNEKEFKALIKTYESITLSDLENNELSNLTGYGSKIKCTLCLAIRKLHNGICECNNCVYGAETLKKECFNECCKGINKETYDAIRSIDNVNVDDSKFLLLAIKARAKHMKEVWKSYLKQRS